MNKYVERRMKAQFAYDLYARIVSDHMRVAVMASSTDAEIEEEAKQAARIANLTLKTIIDTAAGDVEFYTK